MDSCLAMITVYSKYRTVYVLHLRGVYTQPNNLETRQYVIRRIFQWRGLTVRITIMKKWSASTKVSHNLFSTWRSEREKGKKISSLNIRARCGYSLFLLRRARRGKSVWFNNWAPFIRVHICRYKQQTPQDLICVKYSRWLIDSLISIVHGRD